MTSIIYGPTLILSYLRVKNCVDAKQKVLCSSYLCSFLGGGGGGFGSLLAAPFPAASSSDEPPCNGCLAGMLPFCFPSSSAAVPSLSPWQAPLLGAVGGAVPGSVIGGGLLWALPSLASFQTAAPLTRPFAREVVPWFVASFFFSPSFRSLSSSSSSSSMRQFQPELWWWGLCQRSDAAEVWFSVGTLKWPSLAEMRKSMGSSGRGTGDEMDGERLEVPSLGRSVRGTGDDMDGERLEVPSLGERVVLFGGMGGLDWGLG